MRSVCFSGWLIVAAGVGLWCCSIDDRSPSEVMASNQPSEGSAAGAGSNGAASNGAVSNGAVSNGGTVTPPNQGSGSTPRDGEPGSSGVAGAGNGSAGTNPEDVGSPPGGAGSGGMINPGAAGNSGVPVDGEPGMGMSGATGNSSGPPGNTSEPPGGGSAPTISSTCPAFTACGGDLTGTWAYADACPGGNFDLLLTQCPTASVQHESGAPATLSFSGGQVARSGAPVGDGVVIFPSECGFACSLVAALVGTAGNCSEAVGDCVCRTPFSIAWSQQAYTVSGSQLTQADGRTFDYCVTGDTLTYRETGDAKEPGVFTLQRN